MTILEGTRPAEQVPFLEIFGPLKCCLQVSFRYIKGQGHTGQVHSKRLEKLSVDNLFLLSNALNIRMKKLQICLSKQIVNHTWHNPWNSFLECWKKLWEKYKLLVTRTSLFSTLLKTNFFILD